MSTNVSFNIPAEIADALGSTPEEVRESVRKTLSRKTGIKWPSRGRKAAAAVEEEVTTKRRGRRPKSATGFSRNELQQIGEAVAKGLDANRAIARVRRVRQS